MTAHQGSGPTATDELGKHEQRIAEAQRRVQARGRDLAELGGKVSELKQQRVNAYADEDERKAGQLSKKIADAQAKQQELDERRAGAELAARRAAAEHQAFVQARYRDLVAEIEPQAREAAQAIDGLADQLLAALKEWDAVKGRVAGLAHLAGQTERAPALGWDELARDLRRRPRPTPSPLPQWFAAVTVVKHDDPDPTVREPARAAIGEKSE